jgi:hypothetical protein
MGLLRQQPPLMILSRSVTTKKRIHSRAVRSVLKRTSSGVRFLSQSPYKNVTLNINAPI